MEINTVLLITPNQSGELIAQIQSGITPFPRIIKVSSPQALEEAWNNQKNGQIFYNSVYSIGLNTELTEKMKELGIKDGLQVKAKKYRLGNQSQEYELKEDYLGWRPRGNEDWQEWCFDNIRNTELIIFNPQNNADKIIFLHHFIIKDAFPLSFFGEKRAEKWNNFAIVSETKTSEKFIIPLVSRLALTKEQKQKICDYLDLDEGTPADETPGESVKKLLGLSEEEYEELGDEIDAVMMNYFGHES
jgi:hypothetical protein